MMVTFFSKQQAVKGKPAFLVNRLFDELITTPLKIQKFIFQTSLLLLTLCFSWTATAQITNLKFSSESATYSAI